MRAYILTNVDVKVIKRFLENGERLEGFAVLLSRCKRSMPNIQHQLKLVEEFIVKASEK
jgi:hypothetical protein